MTQTVNSEIPKDASSTVVAQQSAMLNALPFSDTADFDDASRGFVGTLENARIANAQGRVGWSPMVFCPMKKRPQLSTQACGGSRGSICSTDYSRWCPASIRCAGSTSP